MAEQAKRDGTRKKPVGKSSPAKKKVVKKTTKKKNDAHVQDFSKEKVGGYSPEHIISKLRKIRDNSLDHMLDNAETGNHKGSLASLALYEGSCRNLDREEAIARGEVPGEGALQIDVTVPGLNTQSIVIAGQPKPNGKG